MTNRMKSGATMVTCGAALAFGAWALGTGVGSSQSDAATGTNAAATTPYANSYGAPYRRPGMGGPGDHRGFGPGRGPGLTAAAKKLGVSTAKLRAALKTVMTQQRSAHEKAEAAALAKALGLPESKVAAALAKARPDKSMRKERRLDRSGFVKQLASALNKKPAAVRKALKSAEKAGGDRFAALAKSLGVSETQLRAAMMKSLPKPGQRHEFRTQKLSALAKALGVSQAKLKAALKSQRGTLKPDQGAFAAALAKELGVSEAKVKSAFPAAGKGMRFRHRMGPMGRGAGAPGQPPAGYPGTTPGAGPPPAPPSGNPI